MNCKIEYIFSTRGNITLLETDKKYILSFGWLNPTEIKKFPNESVLDKEYKPYDKLNPYYSLLEQKAKKVTIIGGGLGDLSQQYLRKEPPAEVITIEYNREIANLCKKLSGVECLVEDGLKYDYSKDGHRDVIVIDAFNNIEKSIVKEFHQESFLRRILDNTDIILYNLYGADPKEFLIEFGQSMKDCRRDFSYILTHRKDGGNNIRIKLKN